MLTDPVDEKENRFGDLIGFSYEVSSLGVREWRLVFHPTKSDNSRQDAPRLKTDAPKGKRYAY